MKQKEQKTIDYSCLIMNSIQNMPEKICMIKRDPIYFPTKDFSRFATEETDIWEGVCPKAAYFCVSREKSPFHCLTWINFGKTLLTGSQSGDASRWNGNTMACEDIIQAHESGLTAVEISHNEKILATGASMGEIKLWDRNMLKKSYISTSPVHEDVIKGISFSPSDCKIATCSDDKTSKIIDIETWKVETVFAKHGAEVKASSWHPSKSLILSGGKDNLGKLWDPKSGEELCTLYSHYNQINKIKWHSNGNWVATASKDCSVRVHDIRTMKAFSILQKHKKDITCIAWHPTVEELLVSGSVDSSLIFWNIKEEVAIKEIPAAHEKEITDLSWHPLGHKLATCSLDNTAKFWIRAKFGDLAEEYASSKPTA